MKKRIVSALLALCLLASLGTVSALAAGTNTARTFSDVTDLDTAAEIESLQCPLAILFPDKHAVA